MSKLVEVHFLDVVARGESAVPALREVTRPGSRLLPALDADIWLTPAGVCRPPFGALGAGLDKAVFHREADATGRSLLARVADALISPQEPVGAVQGTGVGQPARRLSASETP